MFSGAEKSVFELSCWVAQKIKKRAMSFLTKHINSTQSKATQKWIQIPYALPKLPFCSIFILADSQLKGKNTPLVMSFATIYSWTQTQQLHVQEFSRLCTDPLASESNKEMWKVPKFLFSVSEAIECYQCKRHEVGLATGGKWQELSPKLSLVPLLPWRF